MPYPAVIFLLVRQCLAVSGLAVATSLGLGAPGAVLDDVGLVNGLIVITLWFFPLLAKIDQTIAYLPVGCVPSWASESAVAASTPSSTGTVSSCTGTEPPSVV